MMDLGAMLVFCRAHDEMARRRVVSGRVVVALMVCVIVAWLLSLAVGGETPAPCPVGEV